MNLGIYCALAGIAGAKLLMIVLDPAVRDNWREIFSLSTLQAAGIFYGGFMAALVMAGVYMWRKGLPVLKTMDVFAPGLALGHAIGRLGCFSAGCCWGLPTHLPWAVTFTNPRANELVGVPLNMPLHPTQLYEAGAEALILACLLVFERRGRPFPGRTFWSYLLLYGISRFVIEFYRGDSRGMVFNVLSTSQFVSVVLVPLSIVMLVVLSRRPDPTRHAAAQRAAA